MYPCSSANNIVDRPLVDAELLRNGNLHFSIRDPIANFEHLIPGEFAHSASALLRHVCHVVCVSTQKEVSGIAAMTIVAMMADLHAFWNWAVMQFVGDSSGDSRPVGPIHRSSGFCGSALPLPTIIGAGYDYTAPESVFEWDFFDGWQWSKRAMMTVQKSNRVSGYPTSFVAIAWRNWRIFAAPTLAFAIGLQQSVFGYPGGVFGCAAGKVWGMIVHVEKLLSAFGQSLGLLAQSPGTFYWCYRSDYTTEKHDSVDDVMAAIDEYLGEI